MCRDVPDGRRLGIIVIVCCTLRKLYICKQDDGFRPYSTRSPQQSSRDRYHAE
jgi:hypothetical protein